MSRRQPTKPRSRFRWRIQAVLTIAMLLLVVLFVCSITLVETIRQRSSFRDELESRGVLVAQVLDRVLADALYFDDVERARHLSELVQAMPEVDRYRVFNPSGRILVDSDTPKYGAGAIDRESLETVLDGRTTTLSREGQIHVVSPISVGENVLGGVVVSLDTAAIAPRVRQMVLGNIRQGAIAIVIGIVLAFLLARWLTLPVRRLTASVRRVAAGDLSFKAENPRGDEIGDLAEAFEEMCHDLSASRAELEATHDRLVRSERLAVLGQLAGGIAHEVRTPLGVLTNSIFSLQRLLPGADERRGQILERMSRAVRAANRIVSELLDYVRAPALEAESFDLVPVIERALAALETPDTIELDLRLGDRSRMIRGNADHAEQILSNLITNAVQAMPEGGRLTLRCYRFEDQIITAVSDTGVGIAEEDHAKVFAPLYSTKTTGIGLGLAVAQKFATMYGGAVDFDSEVGVGSTFRLIMPADLEEDQDSD